MVMTNLAINQQKLKPYNKTGQQLVTPSLLLHKGLAVELGKAISEFAQTRSETTSAGKVNKLRSLMMTCASNNNNNNNNWHNDPCNKTGLQLVLQFLLPHTGSAVLFLSFFLKP